MTKQILSGLILGVATGLFFGEYVAFLSIGGDAYIGLMQMTVLPYIMISLMVNLGQLDLTKSRKLIRTAAYILLISLVFGMSLVVTVPVFFPEWTSASFFSTSLLSDGEPIDLVAMYIPSNPFRSLAENVVPAVVLFSILVGVSLMSVDGKSGLIKGMTAFADALNKANKIIIRLTPVGIFAIAASTAGTITLDEIGLLQIYLIVYTTLCLVLTIVTIPLLISVVTPFKYRDLIKIPSSTLLTIFATGKIIILLPQLIENVNSLFEKEGLKDHDVETSSQLLFPLAYPFPNLGTLLILIFVPFAGWFVGKPLDIEEATTLLSAGILSSFVAPISGIPYLLDLLQIPMDTFQMFTISTVYTDRIRVVLGAMFLFGLTILSISQLKGILKYHLGKLLYPFLLTVVILLAVFIPMKQFAGESFKNSYDSYQLFVDMDLRYTHGEASEKEYRSMPDSLVAGFRSLAEIKKSGVLRVAHYSDALPFAFRNNEGHVVGFDMEMANALAHDLELELELVRIPRGANAECLNRGCADLVMSGTAIEINLLEQLDFTIPYMSQTFALLVRDHSRNDFKSMERIRSLDSLTIAVVGSAVMAEEIEDALPNVTTTVVPSPRDFFRQEEETFDALLYTAEAGSAWTLIYPQYTVVIPSTDMLKLPMAYPVAKGNLSLLELMNGWITIRKEEGFVQRHFEDWILGKASLSNEPRWSIARDVLNWFD